MHSFSESIHSDLLKLWHYRYNLGPWEKSHFNIQNKEKHINKYYSRYLQNWNLSECYESSLDYSDSKMPHPVPEMRPMGFLRQITTHETVWETW